MSLYLIESKNDIEFTLTKGTLANRGVEIVTSSTLNQILTGPPNDYQAAKPARFKANSALIIESMNIVTPDAPGAVMKLQDAQNKDNAYLDILVVAVDYLGNPIAGIPLVGFNLVIPFINSKLLLPSPLRVEAIPDNDQAYWQIFTSSKFEIDNLKLSTAYEGAIFQAREQLEIQTIGELA